MSAKVTISANTLLALAHGDYSRREALTIIEAAARACKTPDEARDLSWIVQSSPYRTRCPYDPKHQLALYRAWFFGATEWAQRYDLRNYRIPAQPSAAAKLSRKNRLARARSNVAEAADYAMLGAIFAALCAAILWADLSLASSLTEGPSYSARDRAAMSQLVKEGIPPFSCSVTLPCEAAPRGPLSGGVKSIRKPVPIVTPTTSRLAQGSSTPAALAQ